MYLKLTLLDELHTGTLNAGNGVLYWGGDGELVSGF